MDNDDPYDILNPQIGTVFVSQEPTPSEEEKLYHELIGKYQGIIGASGTTMDNSMWESYNAVLQKLIEKGHNDYSRFIVQPTKLGPRDFINFDSFKSQLMSALQRMSKDFNFSDPNYLIYRDMPKTGNQIHANAVASPIQNNNQNQSQTQNQEIELTIEQKISKIEHELEEKLTSEQLAEIKPALEEFKAEPTKWSKASKLMKAILNLSKDVAIGVISNIISTQLNIPKLS